MGVAYGGGGQSSPFVDVTIDGDASSCTTSDDVTPSDEVISNPGSDVTESPQQAANHQPAAAPAGGNVAWSVDSGHCSGASDVTSDVTVTSSSDTETLDAGSEEGNDDDDEDGDDDNESRVTSETLERRSNATVRSCDSLSILDLLADSSRVTDL